MVTFSHLRTYIIGSLLGSSLRAILASTSDEYIIIYMIYDMIHIIYVIPCRLDYSHIHPVTTPTFLPFCLYVFPKRLHPWVALHHTDNVTDIHQGFCIAFLFQACMKELSLYCCIHFLPNCLSIAICMI